MQPSSRQSCGEFIKASYERIRNDRASRQERPLRAEAEPGNPGLGRATVDDAPAQPEHRPNVDEVPVGTRLTVVLELHENHILDRREPERAALERNGRSP